MSHLKVSYIALVPAITPTVMHGFQNNLAQLLLAVKRDMAVTIFVGCMCVCA